MGAVGGGLRLFTSTLAVLVLLLPAGADCRADQLFCAYHNLLLVVVFAAIASRLIPTIFGSQKSLHFCTISIHLLSIRNFLGAHKIGRTKGKSQAMID